MSNLCSQQEIATPKDCNRRFFAVIAAVTALIFFVAVCLCSVFAPNNGKVILFTVLGFALISIIDIAICRKNKSTVAIVLQSLTIAVAAMLCGYIASSTKPDKINIIVTVISAAMILAAINAVFYPHATQKRMTTKYITYCATFTALSIICKMLGNAVSSVIIIPNMRLSFVYVPWVLSGIVLGPIGGVITGLAGDVLGQLAVAVGGSINPLTTLSNALFALFPALVFKFSKIKKDWLKLLIGMAISMVICTMGIGGYALYTWWGYDKSMSFVTYLVTIRSPQIIIIAINYVLTLLVLPAIKKANALTTKSAS